MNQNMPSPDALWRMSPEAFNDWRANNDIPALIEFLRTLLPAFSEWEKSLPFDSSVTMRVVPTGDIFKGATRKVVIEYDKWGTGRSTFECFDGTSEEVEVYWDKREKRVKIHGEFEPYFAWAKRKLGRKRFFSYDKVNGQRTDTFQFTGWEIRNAVGALSHAQLLRELQVLKLGQISLGKGTVIGGRNLDFTDLDYLIIEDDFHGSLRTVISYSSCRKITVRSANIAFVSFYQCVINEFVCDDSKIQDFSFDEVKSMIGETAISLSNSSVYKLIFNGSAVAPMVENCELRETEFIPSSKASPEQIARTYRLFRSAYQKNGQRRESSASYYKERVFERKSYFNPYRDYRNLFPSMPYGGSLVCVYDLWYSGHIDQKDILSAAGKAMLSRARMWLSPKYLYRAVSFKVRWIASGLECLVWGYGERPSRILTAALLLIGGYAAIFHRSLWPCGDHCLRHLSWVDSIYFSIVTFTTLGYGDIAPNTSFLKLASASEAICGALSIGLLIAGFSNRSKY